MWAFLIYEAKVAVALLVFYLFYRFLLKKETFHRFNRIVLLATSVISFLLPLCIITIHRPAPVVENSGLVAVGDISADGAAAVSVSTPWWQFALTVLFWAGVAFVLVRVIVSILSIIRIIRRGECVGEEDGCRIIVTDRDINPFSWMRYIVLSRQDWGGTHRTIIDHEKAHIKYGHSMDMLLVNTLAAFQWFNPAIWMLLTDLQELHEYEADDAVLRSGANLKDYQYLLIRKAVGKSGYSVANSFNHSILKNRITMMSKSKSPLRRALRVLYALPLLCLALGLQAQTVYDKTDKVNEKDVKDTTSIRIRSAKDEKPHIIIRQANGEESEISQEVFHNIDRNRIGSVTVYQKDSDYAKEKFDGKADGGIILITMKSRNELDPMYVISEKEPAENAADTTGRNAVLRVTGAREEKIEKKNDDGPVEFFLVNPDTMPTFQGENMNGFAKWLHARIERPKDCKHEGFMKVAFTVDVDGSIEDVAVIEGICEELDGCVVSQIKKSPKWEPATSNGHPVRQRLILPITFMSR